MKLTMVENIVSQLPTKDSPIYNSRLCSITRVLLSWSRHGPQSVAPFSNPFCGTRATAYCSCTLNGCLFVAHLDRPPTMSILVSTPSLLTIPPFYEPGAPPPILPILIAQTEVGTTKRPDKLLAQEDLGTGPTRNHTSNSTHRFTPYPKRQPSKHSRSSTPKHRDLTPGTESDGESQSDSSDSATSEDHLIPKPDGEAGRPGRGGYNLEEALGWEHKKYCRIKV